MKKITLATLLLFLLAACTKHKNDTVELAPKALIHFASPVSGGLYSPGENVLIQATAISSATIHGYDLIIRKAEDTAKLYFHHFHDHSDTLQIKRTWKAEVSNAILQAEVVLYLNHDGNTAQKTVNFKVK